MYKRQERIGKVLNPYHISFIAKARKPLPIGINKELKALNLKKDQVLMVGDQLITDIQAGNLAGVTTCLLYTSPSPRDRTRSRMPSSA